MKTVYDVTGAVLAYTQDGSDGLQRVFSPRGALLGFVDQSGTFLADAAMIATEPDIGLLIDFGIDNKPH